MATNPYAETGRLHRRKGYAIDRRFFERARYTPENVVDYLAAYNEAGRWIDDRAGFAKDSDYAGD